GGHEDDGADVELAVARDGRAGGLRRLVGGGLGGGGGGRRRGRRRQRALVATGQRRGGRCRGRRRGRRGGRRGRNGRRRRRRRRGGGRRGRRHDPGGRPGLGGRRRRGRRRGGGRRRGRRDRRGRRRGHRGGGGRGGRGVGVHDLDPAHHLGVAGAAVRERPDGVEPELELAARPPQVPGVELHRSGVGGDGVAVGGLVGPEDFAANVDSGGTGVEEAVTVGVGSRLVLDVHAGREGGRRRGRGQQQRPQRRQPGGPGQQHRGPFSPSAHLPALQRSVG